jgi:hypothetical protein
MDPFSRLFHSTGSHGRTAPHLSQSIDAASCGGSIAGGRRLTKQRSFNDMQPPTPLRSKHVKHVKHVVMGRPEDSRSAGHEESHWASDVLEQDLAGREGLPLGDTDMILVGEDVSHLTAAGKIANWVQENRGLGHFDVHPGVPVYLSKDNPEELSKAQLLDLWDNLGNTPGE